MIDDTLEDGDDESVPDDVEVRWDELEKSTDLDDIVTD
jgi:hypothetical protein